MALAGMRADASKDCLETHQNVTRITNKYHRKSICEQDSYAYVPLEVADECQEDETASPIKKTFNL